MESGVIEGGGDEKVEVGGKNEKAVGGGTVG